MKIEAKYGGKWIAIKNEKVIESDKSLKKLNQKIQQKKDSKNIAFALIPKGLMAGAI